MSTIKNYNEIMRDLNSIITMREEAAKVLKSFKILYKKNGEEFATISRKGFEVVGGDNVRVYDEGNGFCRVSLHSYIVDFKVKTYQELSEQVQKELTKTEQAIKEANEEKEKIKNSYDATIKEIEKFYNKMKDNPAANKIFNSVLYNIEDAAKLDTINRNKERTSWLKYVDTTENIEELKNDFKKDLNAEYKNGGSLKNFTFSGEQTHEFNEVLYINNNYYTYYRWYKKGLFNDTERKLHKNNIVAVNIEKLNAFNRFFWLSHINELKLNDLRKKAAALFKKCNALKNYNFDNESVLITSGSVHGFYFPNIAAVDCIAFIEKYGNYYPVLIKII